MTDHEYWTGLTDPGQDRAAITHIGSALLSGLARHDLASLGGWSAHHHPDVEGELARLRRLVHELGTIVATGQDQLRHLDIARSVRGVWAQAFAAGDVDDAYEENPYGLLTVGGVAHELAQANTTLGPYVRIPPALVREVFGRIVATEHPPEDDHDQQARNLMRAGQVAEYFTEAVLATETDPAQGSELPPARSVPLPSEKDLAWRLQVELATGDTDTIWAAATRAAASQTSKVALIGIAVLEALDSPAGLQAGPYLARLEALTGTQPD